MSNVLREVVEGWKEHCDKVDCDYCIYDTEMRFGKKTFNLCYIIEQLKDKLEEDA